MCLAVLVADEAIASLSECLPLDVQQGAQVLEEAHLVAVVLSVVLDVALMRPQLLNQDLLLPKLQKQKHHSNTQLTFAVKNS